MMWENWLAVTLATALSLALLAAPVVAGGKPSFAGPGANTVRSNVGGADRGLDRASHQASPQGQQGITKAQEAISDPAQDNPMVEQHNPNVPLTPSPSSQP